MVGDGDADISRRTVTWFAFKGHSHGDIFRLSSRGCFVFSQTSQTRSSLLTYSLTSAVRIIHIASGINFLGL
jgi:hypothetical protein